MAEDSGTTGEAAPTETLEAGTQPNSNGMTPAWVPDFEAKSGTKIPEKYQRATLDETMAEVAKAHQSLETKLGQQAKPTEPEAPPAAEPAKQAKMSEVLEKSGLSQDDLAETWTKDGKLTDDQYAKLEAAGFDRDEVDDRARGMAATAELARIHAEKRDARGLELAGGKDQYKNLSAWIEQNYTAEQLASYNDAVTGNSIDAVEVAVGSAVNAYNKSIGADGSRPLVGGGVPRVGASGFASDDEFVQFLGKNPNWHNDPVLAKSINDKLANSPNVTLGMNPRNM